MKTTASILRPLPVRVPEGTVTIRMSETQASRLYGLTSHIRKVDGFDEIHQALKDLGISKQVVHLDFVGNGILRVESW